MNNKYLKAKDIKNIILFCFKKLESKKEYINRLNVFPVPDGDTGTNMALTLSSIVKELNDLNEDDLNLKNVLEVISIASLKGARGNSGVILSQLLRGLTKSLLVCKNKIYVKDIKNAFIKAKETAYKAVIKPKEGTILTIARVIAENIHKKEFDVEDLIEFFEKLVDISDKALKDTPNLLPILKEANVVDSGGAGLVEIIKSVYDYLQFKINNVDIDYDNLESFDITKNDNKEVEKDIKYGYCTEFIIDLKDKIKKVEENKLKEFLQTQGDSVICITDNNLLKIHIHTENPGNILQKGLSFGQLINIKIDNLRQECKDIKSKNEQQKKMKDVGFVVVAHGEGIKNIFSELGVDCIIEGGQSMNPSTNDIINACKESNSKNVFVFPNNGNIIFAAKQAADICKDINIIIIPTKTIPQGIAAIVSYLEEDSIKNNIKNFNKVIKNIKTGQITYSIKDTIINKQNIKKGDYISLIDDDLKFICKEIEEAVLLTLNDMVKADSSNICIYYSNDKYKVILDKIISEIEEKYVYCDVQVCYGGQSVYEYIISVE